MAPGRDLAEGDVADLLRELGKPRVDEKGRQHGGKIAATRTKALMSAAFNFARANGITNAPNPCAGMRETKAIRKIYDKDADLAACWSIETVRRGLPRGRLSRRSGSVRGTRAS